MVKFLVDAKADLEKARDARGRRPLFRAVSRYDGNVVCALIAGRADVNAVTEDGTTPLFAAVESGDLRVVKVLLDAGADIEKARKDGTAPLLRACELQLKSTVCLLIEQRAVVDRRRAWDGQTAISRSSASGYSEIVSILAGVQA
ncbi:unnamed protein product [Symbiodinium pilosum]|uniref:Ankyrin repeat domain-containing protein n=1 Tax=Symbiodinium pilosum TaxID=2952 RepID=A0A812QEM0_SYMPI|nr:unnamed protein product [Symbiodinium pilosum]